MDKRTYNKILFTHYNSFKYKKKTTTTTLKDATYRGTEIKTQQKK